jgi:hypothetical protein
VRFRSKRTEEGKKNVFTTKVLVPKMAVVRKEEGATAAASHLPSPTQLNSAGSLDCRLRAGRAAFCIEESKSVGNSH